MYKCKSQWVMGRAFIFVSRALQLVAATRVTWDQSLRYSSGASPLRSPPNPPDAPCLCLPSPLIPSSLPAISPLYWPFSCPLPLPQLPPPPLALLLTAHPPPETGSLIATGWRRRQKQESSTCKAERKPNKAWILSTSRQRQTHTETQCSWDQKQTDWK